MASAAAGIFRGFDPRRLHFKHGGNPWFPREPPRANGCAGLLLAEPTARDYSVRTIPPKLTLHRPQDQLVLAHCGVSEGVVPSVGRFMES
jgi:hypothetical protein